uniref:Uncharacterized protein n=1 Tax=Anguilla anguilla TaxID=7936 RepID=A0A0E9PBS4_ANGAN
MPFSLRSLPLAILARSQEAGLSLQQNRACSLFCSAIR